MKFGCMVGVVFADLMKGNRSRRQAENIDLYTTALELTEEGLISIPPLIYQA
jgi:hypothetical protein